ncbi:MAG TPA: hypothetical protein VFB58_11075 [Chloroflexota bacterium]|nr:hypothetical protein [Chloroflexota bacterium]
MRSLPAGLAALIAAPSQTPTLTLTVQDLQPHLTVLASGDAPGRSSALLSSTGMLLRAVVAQNAATNQTLTVQTITPANASSWTSPAVTVTSNAKASAGCCLAQTGGTTRLFYQRSSDNCICYRDSTDDGHTWGAETLVQSVTPGSLPYCYGIAASSITTIWTVWAAFDPYGVCSMYQSAYSTSWSAWVLKGPSNPGWGQMRGLTCLYAAGTLAFACGCGLRGYTSGISASTFTLTGSTYSAVTPIQQLDSPTQGLTLAYPDLCYDATDTSGFPWYAIATLTDDGSVSTSAHTRTTVFRSADGITWHPWLAAGTALAWGAHVLVAGGTVYLFDAATTYVVAAPPSATDLSTDVLEADISEGTGAPAEGTIVLDNSRAQYVSAPWLVDNAGLTLALGYGGLTVTTHTLYLEGWEFAADPEAQYLTLRVRGALGLMDMPSTLLLSYSGQTLAALVTAVCRQAGMSLNVLPATPQFAQTIPCFTILPGETWLSALLRLSTIYGFEVFTASNGAVVCVEPQTSDPSTWSYGSEILTSSWGMGSRRPNVVRVVGAATSTGSVWSEAVDQTNLLAVGQERYMIEVERLLDTSAKCAIRAGIALRGIQRDAQFGTLAVSLNPQHELCDVITVSDAANGVSAQPVRIAGIRWLTDARQGDWYQELTLEAV